MHEDRIAALDDQMSASVNRGQVIGVTKGMYGLFRLAERCRAERDGDFGTVRDMIAKWLEMLAALEFPPTRLNEWRERLRRLLR